MQYNRCVGLLKQEEKTVQNCFTSDHGSPCSLGKQFCTVVSSSDMTAVLEFLYIKSFTRQKIVAHCRHKKDIYTSSFSNGFLKAEHKGSRCFDI